MPLAGAAGDFCAGCSVAVVISTQCLSGESRPKYGPTVLARLRLYSRLRTEALTLPIPFPRKYGTYCATAALTGFTLSCFFFQSPIAARIASSASTAQWILTGGSDSSFTMSMFLMARASSTVLPLTHSVAKDDDAIAEPQPNVLNLASSITLVSRLTLICSFITSPHSGAPTRPVPTSALLLSIEPTLRGLL